MQSFGLLDKKSIVVKGIRYDFTGYSSLFLMANYPKKTSSLLLAMEGVLCHWKVHVLRALRAAFVANVFSVASEQPGLKLRFYVCTSKESGRRLLIY